MSMPPRSGAEIPAFHPSSRKNGFMGVTPTPPAPCQPTDPPPGSASSLLDSSSHPPPAALLDGPFPRKGVFPDPFTPWQEGNTSR